MPLTSCPHPGRALPFLPVVMLSIVFALACAVPLLHATGYNVGTSGDWATTTTWSPASPVGGPTLTDTFNAVTTSSWAVNLGGNQSIASIGSSGTTSAGQIDFSSSTAGVNLLTITGNISKTQSAAAELRFLDGPAGTIQLNVGGTVTVSAGTLVLSGNNTITGATTLGGTAAATLHLKSAGALGTSALTFTSTSTIDNIANNLTWRHIDAGL